MHTMVTKAPQKENHQQSLRKGRILQLLCMIRGAIKQYREVSRKKLILFCMSEFGSSQRTAREYINDLEIQEKISIKGDLVGIHQ